MLELSKAEIAVITQEPTHTFGRVVVVVVNTKALSKFPFLPTTNGASPVLPLEQFHIGFFIAPILSADMAQMIP